MKVLVTGAAGFIGFHLCRRLLEEGYEVLGLDNVNGYYDVKLKFARLEELGISQIDATPFNIRCESSKHGNQFRFIRMNLEDRERLPRLFRKEKFDIVCNLAAQAGVRFSIDNPEPYIDSNLVGFQNLLECCKNFEVEHLVYASSSSIYGLSPEAPFEVEHKSDSPVSLYAATKKSNELMAFTYSHLFGLNTSGLRFFTVYGPWGRPDMAIFLFTDAILHDRPIKVFNEGKMERDFTYVDDTVEGIMRVIRSGPASGRAEGRHAHEIYNLGNGQSVKLTEFIDAIENATGREARKEFLPMQPGDVKRTWAGMKEFEKEFGKLAHTGVHEGVRRFVEWYREYYGQ